VSISLLRILCDDMILVAATAAAVDAVVSTPCLTPSSNVTDFLLSNPCLPVEVVSVVKEEEREEPEKNKRIIYSFNRYI